MEPRPRYCRVYADPGGESHFQEVEVSLATATVAPPAPPLDVSAVQPASGLVFLRATRGWLGDWHPTPRRQLFVLLSGDIEVEVGDGECRRFATGSAILVEDTSGRGHVTRVVGDRDATFVVVHMAD